jgi:hypothetical protein
VDEADLDFRLQLQRRILTYRERRAALAAHRAEVDAEIEDMERRLRSAEELHEAEFGEPFMLGSSVEEPDLRTPEPRVGPLTRLSWGDAVIRVLDENGALHVKEIWRLLQEGGFRTDARDPLRSIVAIAIRLGPRVLRVAPNTYALTSAISENVMDTRGA